MNPGRKYSVHPLPGDAQRVAAPLPKPPPVIASGAQPLNPEQKKMAPCPFGGLWKFLDKTRFPDDGC